MPVNLTTQQRDLVREVLTDSILPLIVSQNLTKSETLVLWQKAINRRRHNNTLRVTKSHLDAAYAWITDGQPWPSIQMANAVDQFLSTTDVNNYTIDNLVTNIRSASGFIAIDQEMVTKRLGAFGYTLSGDTVLKTIPIPVATTPEQATNPNMRLVNQVDLDRTLAHMTQRYDQLIRDVLETARLQGIAIETLQVRMNQATPCPVVSQPVELPEPQAFGRGVNEARSSMDFGTHGNYFSGEGNLHGG